MERLKSQVAVLGTAAVLAALFAGCASVDQGGDPSKVVGERAQARWDALVKGETEKAYTYISPTSRKTYPWETYRGATRMGFWRKVTVDKVVCPTQENCDVDVTIEYVYRGSPVKTPLRESWTRQDGEWWYVLKSL